MKLLSPAKINLVLKILRRREDGYHDLAMLMEKLNVCDEIELEKTSESIEVATPIEGVPLEKDLTFKAAKALQEIGDVSKGVRIKVTKKIPMGGGLGGGSSNAATVLRGLNELWELRWPVEKLVKIGARIGADVPFFLYEGPARVEGIGDKVTPLKRLPKLWIILVNPGIHLSTPMAYATWDQERDPSLRKGGGNQLTQENQSVRWLNDFRALVEHLHNDFEEVILPKYPEISRAKEALSQVGAKGVLMSGSGSTVFGIFENRLRRDQGFENLERRPGWKIFTAENRK